MAGLGLTIEKETQILHEVLHPFVWNLARVIFNDENIEVYSLEVEYMVGCVQFFSNPGLYLENGVVPMIFETDSRVKTMIKRCAYFLSILTIYKNNRAIFDWFYTNVGDHYTEQYFDIDEDINITFEYHLSKIFDKINISKTQIIQTMQEFLTDCQQGFNLVESKFIANPRPN